MIRRTLDAAKLNAVANHPEVRPWIGGQGVLDLAPLVSDPANYAFDAKAGGWVFVRHEAGIYEVHTLFLREGRGLTCHDPWRHAIRFLFTATDAREIVTRVPQCNPGAVAAAKWTGFRERFVRLGAFQTANGAMADVSYQALTIDNWWPKDPEALRAGELFHAQIECAKVEADSSLPDHPEDAIHDRAAGAAALMMLAGNPRKAAWFYNRWARLAGYSLIGLISKSPLVVDVGAGVVVQVIDGKMEVVKCP